MADKKNKLTKAEHSWAMYDWANSVYSTIIVTAIFPIYFTARADAAGVSGDVWWGYGTSIATVCVVLLAPLFGSIADFGGMKKKLLCICMLFGAAFTLLMAVAAHWELMLVGYVLSYLGYALGNVFYDSFLTDVTTQERMDYVSAKGYAYGYIGGSTIPFLVALLLVTFAGRLHITGEIAVKLCVVMTSIWWALFSLPLLRNVKQYHFMELPKNGVLRAGLKNMGRTVRDIVGIKPLWMYMVAYFFYIDGVNTVIHMATSYGTTLGLGTVGMVGALMVTQFVAIPCTVGFSRVSRSVGTRRTLLAGSCVYFVVCLLGFYMGFSLENASVDAAAAGNEGSAAYQAIFAPALHRSQVLFWVLAVLVGTSQGGMQALSRSQFSRMIPPARSNEFFGFFDIFGKFAAVLGPFLYAFIANITGRSSLGILSLLVLFALGLIMLLIMPKSAFDRSYEELFEAEHRKVG